MTFSGTYQQAILELWKPGNAYRGESLKRLGYGRQEEYFYQLYFFCFRSLTVQLSSNDNEAESFNKVKLRKITIIRVVIWLYILYKVPRFGVIDFHDTIIIRTDIQTKVTNATTMTPCRRIIARLGHFLSNYPKPLSQSESWCPSFHMKMRFHSHAGKLNSFSYEWLCTGPRFDRRAR